MKKTSLLLATLSLLWLHAAPAQARRGFSVAFGPVGNVFLIDTAPIMDPGVGGFMSFDYRFHDQVAFSTMFMMSSQDGTGLSSDDGNIMFMAMPTFALKYFLLKDDPKFDPYIAPGIGVYWLTEGSGTSTFSQNTGGIGLGAQLGAGFDYYLSDLISVGFEGIFHSVALITNLGTPSGSTAIFPYTLLGNVAIHF